MNLEEMPIDTPRCGENFQTVRAWIHETSFNMFVLHMELQSLLSGELHVT